MTAFARPRTGRPRLLLAAWVSPAIPMLTAMTTYLWVYTPGRSFRDLPWAFGFATVACVFGLLSAVAGLVGVRANGPLATVPVAVLGLVLNAALGLYAFCLCGLSIRSFC